MNWRIIRAIARKDLLEVRGNRMAWTPMLILPLIFCVIMPTIALVVIPQTEFPTDAISKGRDVAEVLAMLPPYIAAQLKPLNDHQIVIYFLLAIMLMPLFLIMPIMTSSIIGSEGFVGEKERKTIEPLLYTPASESDLFLGKLLAAIIPALLLCWGSFLVYTLVLNALGASVMGGIWFPTPSWWPLMLWLAPAVSVMGILGAVIVSSRAKTFMEAQQMTSLLVLPVVLLMIGQVSGVLYLSPSVIVIIGCVVWVINVVLLWFSLRVFSRLALMAK